LILHRRMKMIKTAVLCFILWGFALQAQEFVKAYPKKGDGIYAMLRRHKLPTTSIYVNKFRELNADLLASNDELSLEYFYLMPIYKNKFNGVNIRSTLKISDYQLAKQIQNYNEELVRAGVRSSHYTKNLELWTPYFMITELKTEKQTPPPSSPQHPAATGSAGTYKIFGSNYSAVDRIDNSMKGYYFYLVSGHGGPDPGAYGVRGSNRLYEDEYAYDITLRLARRLIEHGATVYIIVRDPRDGIRDAAILRGDHDEKYYGGARISAKPRTRLQKRAAIINNLYAKNKKNAKGQYTLVLHVDSRSNSQRIDMFYYYKRNSSTGKKLAYALHNFVKRKYQQHQPGRGYGGTVTTRNLYMLQNVRPTTVYIEVANIRNSRDQDRLVIVNNRQAVANWLCNGLGGFIN
jgi:N-acetylmuramoyl-L-alanine amidase